MQPHLKHAGLSSRLRRAVALCAVAGLATRVEGQTPRIAPPPPCRVDGRTPFAELTSRPSPASGTTVVGVVPIDARLSDASQVHLPWAFAHGVATRIALLPGVETPSEGTTARLFAEAAGRLEKFAEIVGARLVVSGTIVSQRSGATLRASIMERGAETPRWERDFIYPQTPLSSMEDQVAAAVAEILGTGKPAESDELIDSDAYDELARGDFYLTQHDAPAGDSSRVAYERALSRAPNSALVLGRLARAYAVSLERRGRVGVLGQLSALREGESLADRALRADSATADAWTARAIFARVRDPRRYAGAVAAHERAVRAAPRSADVHQEYAITLLRLGRDEAAESQVRHALSLDRDRATSLRLLAELEYLGRRYGAACALVNASIGADPYDPLAYALRARVRVRLDEFRDAFSDAETASRLSGAPWGETLEFYVTAFAREIDAAKAESRRLSTIKLKAGNTLGVREAAYLGMGLATVGDRDKAFDALSRARPRGAELQSTLRDPGFDRLRSDPRFSRVASVAPTAGAAPGLRSTPPVGGPFRR